MIPFEAGTHHHGKVLKQVLHGSRRRGLPASDAGGGDTVGGGAAASCLALLLLLLLQYRVAPCPLPLLGDVLLGVEIRLGGVGVPWAVAATRRLPTHSLQQQQRGQEKGGGEQHPRGRVGEAWGQQGAELTLDPLGSSARATFAMSLSDRLPLLAALAEAAPPPRSDPPRPLMALPSSLPPSTLPLLLPLNILMPLKVTQSDRQLLVEALQL